MNDVPASIRGPLNELLDIVSDSTPRYFDQLEPSERPTSTVAIIGPRGSGKTTMLAAACRNLSSDKKALVLPILQPEIFEATDSLILACLLYLEKLVAHGASNFENPPTDANVAITRAIRAVAASSGGAYQALQESRESSGQYSIDAASILRHRTAIPELLSQAFEAAKKREGIEASLPTVIPIDDADLNPRNLVNVLTAVRTLGTLRNVVPIMTADEQYLEMAVVGDLAQQFRGSLTVDSLNRLGYQMVAKLVRPERTVSPPWLTFSEKVGFVPIYAEDEGLEGQLATVRGSIYDCSMAESIWVSTPITAPLEPTGINAWLPDTPRQLERLWYAAKSFGTNPSMDSTRRTQWLQRLIEAILQSSEQFTVHLEPARSSLNSSGQSMEMIWPRVSYGVSTRDGFELVDAMPGVRLRIRWLERITGVLFISTSSEDGDKRVRLTNSSVSCVQALQQLALTGFLGENRPGAPDHLGMNEYEFLQQVTMYGQSTDNSFFSMPDSVGAQAMIRSAVSWNYLVSFVRDARNREGRDPSAFVRKYIEIVSGYWATGNDSILRSSRARSLPDVLNEAGMRYSSLQDGKEGDHLTNFTVARSYCHWFEAILPQVFHASLLGEEQCRSAVAAWLNAVSSVGRGAEAVEQLRMHMGSRLNRMLEGQRTRKDDVNSWIYGYFELASVVDAGLLADVLLFESGFKEQRSSTTAGHELLGGQVALANSKGSYEFQPHPTVEGDWELRILRDVLGQIGGR